MTTLLVGRETRAHQPILFYIAQEHCKRHSEICELRDSIGATELLYKAVPLLLVMSHQQYQIEEQAQ
jgi:hypothetical protein